jgi:hypothetical protein
MPDQLVKVFRISRASILVWGEGIHPLKRSVREAVLPLDFERDDLTSIAGSHLKSVSLLPLDFERHNLTSLAGSHFEKFECTSIAPGHAFQNASDLNAALLRQVMLFKIPAL